MTINWFPGHMNKARRLLKERVSRSDMVLEVLDARVPVASQNPMLAEICGTVPRLRVLTKPDLADPKVTPAWLKQLASDSDQTLELQATNPKAAAKLVRACRELVPKRGRPGFPVRIMIAGIPNVGKSTIFNLLAKKKKADVRNQPAVTRREQRIEVEGGLSLVDTPGVLWPKLDDEKGAYRLAVSGAIRDSALDTVDIACFALRFLTEEYPELLMARYKLDSVDGDVHELLTKIGENRGCITRGVGVDFGKVSDLLIHEIRAGKLGQMSLERPDES